MMTPQEVSSSTFPKAAIGGYNMAAVDVFLDKLTEDYTTIYKENAALKAKIKVLVDKMEEYHAMEDTMRSTLLTAQKMASSMITEAEQKRDALIADAEADARVRMRELAADVAAEERRLEAVHAEIDQKIAQEQERLQVAQRELNAFINAAKALCSRQFELIDRLPELNVLPEGFTVEAPAAEAVPEVAAEVVIPAVAEESEKPAEETAVAAEVSEETGTNDAGKLMENMLSMIDSVVNNEPIPEKKEEDDPFADDFDDADSLFRDAEEKKSDESESDDADFDNYTDEDEAAARVINLNELQFGRNYNKD